MTKLEEVARAIGDYWLRVGFDPSEPSDGAARAAVETLREPTEAMMDAVYDHQPAFKCVAGHDLGSDELRDIYRAMIDAILNEKSE